MSSWIGGYALHVTDDTSSSGASFKAQLEKHRDTQRRIDTENKFVFVHQPRCAVSLITGVQRNAGTISVATVTHPFLTDLRAVMSRIERIPIQTLPESGESTSIIQERLQTCLPIWLLRLLEKGKRKDRVVCLPLEAPLVTSSVQCDVTIPISSVACVLKFVGPKEGAVYDTMSLLNLSPRVDNTVETLPAILSSFLGLPRVHRCGRFLDSEGPRDQPLVSFRPRQREIDIVALIDEGNEMEQSGSQTKKTRQFVAHLAKMCAQIILDGFSTELSWRRTEKLLDPSSVRTTRRRVFVVVDGMALSTESPRGSSHVQEVISSITKDDIIVTDSTSFDKGAFDLSRAAAVVHVQCRVRAPLCGAETDSALCGTGASLGTTDIPFVDHFEQPDYPLDFFFKYVSRTCVVLDARSAKVPPVCGEMLGTALHASLPPHTSFVYKWPSAQQLASDMGIRGTKYAPLVIPIPITLENKKPSVETKTHIRCDNVTDEGNIDGISRELDALVALAQHPAPRLSTRKAEIEIPRHGGRAELPVVSPELDMGKMWVTSHLLEGLIDALREEEKNINSNAAFLVNVKKTPPPSVLIVVPSRQASVWRRVLGDAYHDVRCRWDDWIVGGGLLLSESSDEGTVVLSQWTDCIISCVPLSSTPYLEAIRGFFAFPTIFLTSEDYTLREMHERGTSVTKDCGISATSFFYTGTWRPSLMSRMCPYQPLPRTLSHADVGLAPPPFAPSLPNEGGDTQKSRRMRLTLWQQYATILHSGKDRAFGGYPETFCNSIRAIVGRLMVCCHCPREARIVNVNHPTYKKDRCLPYRPAQNGEAELPMEHMAASEEIAGVNVGLTAPASAPGTTDSCTFSPATQNIQWGNMNCLEWD